MKAFAILICALVMLSFSTKGESSDLERLSIRGRVKSLKESTFRAIEQDGRVTRGELQYYYLNTFDDWGNKVLDNRYAPDGRIEKRYDYKYDSLHRRSEQRQFGSDGNLVRTIFYSYDKAGRLAEDISYLPEGTPDKKFTYVYDDRGNIAEDYSYSSGRLQKKFTYVYGNDGLKSESNRFNGEGVFEKRITFSYDSAGNMVSETAISAGGMKTETRFSYDFDSLENWIRRVSFTGTEPETVTEREFGYRAPAWFGSGILLPQMSQ